MHRILMLFDSVAPTADTSGTTSNPGVFDPASLLSFLPLVLILVAFYFFLIRPQQKQQKELTQMRNSLEVGDIITTAGGVIGKVKIIKDDTVTVESAGQKFVIHRWAVSSVDKKVEDEDDD